MAKQVSLMSKFDKELFKKNVIDNVKTLYRKTLDEANPQQIYQAVSYAIKDQIVDNWLKTQEAYEKEDPKTVYYMSMEFLMGRALGNNMINLQAYKPVEEALEKVRSGSNPELSTREKHRRECFVVLESGADAAAVEKAIVTMPNYFADYDTTVHFIDEAEFAKNHSGMAHGGKVIRAGKTGENGKNTHVVEYSIKLDSNPEFTASVLVAYARAAMRFAEEGTVGCKTVLDVPPAYLSQKSGEVLRKELL